MTNQFCFLLIVLLFSCNDTKDKTPNASSIPTPYESTLSEADKKALANAKGRTAKIINIADLHSKIDNASGELHIFCFWKYYVEGSKTQMKNLRDAHRELGQENLKIIYVNLDAESTRKEVNAFIRELGIVEDIYTLSSAYEGQLLKNKAYGWNEKLPAIIIKNNTDGTNLLYQQVLSLDEMVAILTPLLL